MRTNASSNEENIEILTNMKRCISREQKYTKKDKGYLDKKSYTLLKEFEMALSIACRCAKKLNKIVKKFDNDDELITKL